MSLIPWQSLKPVGDPSIKTYPYNLDLDGTALVRFDSVQQLRAYWHKVVVRNFSRMAISYRMNPGDQYFVLPAMGERVVNGWGSYIEFKSTGLPGGLKYGIAEFEMTPIEEAIQ